MTYDRLRNAQAEPQNWLMYWGNYHGTHFPSLKQIDKTNVDRLQDAWTIEMATRGLLQATPVVVDSVMYTSGTPGTIYALDAATGKELWKYERAQKTRNPKESNLFNRGVAVMGNRLFAGTLDAALLALDRIHCAPPPVLQSGKARRKPHAMMPPLSEGVTPCRPGRCPQFWRCVSSRSHSLSPR